MSRLLFSWGLFLISRVRNASLVSTCSTTTSLCVVLLRLVVMVFFRLVLPVLLYRIAYFCCGFEQVFYLVLLFGMSLPGMSIGPVVLVVQDGCGVA